MRSVPNRQSGQAAVHRVAQASCLHCHGRGTSPPLAGKSVPPTDYGSVVTVEDEKAGRGLFIAYS